MKPMTTLNEARFDPHCLNKYATLMAAGNGYLGIRATHEESYSQQNRGMYMAGLYHRAGERDVTELINLPDVVGMDLEIDGAIFSLLSGEILDWRRELSFSSGEVMRDVLWRAPNGRRYRITSRRFLSAAQKSLFAMRLSITPLHGAAQIKLTTGIDATQTNSGRQHLDEISLRVYDERYLQGVYRVQGSQIDVSIGCYCTVTHAVNRISAVNRKLLQHATAHVAQGETLCCEKICWIAGDPDHTPDGFEAQNLAALKTAADRGYEALLDESRQAMAPWWRQSRVELDCDDAQDQQALDFALYHLHAMTPAHDERASIAAKGLTGEGYKGHVFWDTEVFLLPFWLYTHPETARQLLRYRWHNLPGAQHKARRCGYQGALFPWESARTGEEETPEFAAINIRTGQRQRVASAQAEHHLVADIAWAVMRYGDITGDEAFLQREGGELLYQTACFWMSRTTEVDGHLEIHDVIGPDEYTEHVNNNAFTNYMALYNVANALKHGPAARLTADFKAKAADFIARLRLPLADSSHVVPQDDSFFSKPCIDLSRYQALAGKQTILQDYSRAEVNEMQILKQADVVMLFYLQPGLFTPDVQKASLAWYLPRTIHDSSLSKTIHGIVAARCNDPQTAYRFWREGSQIDLGDDPHSCDDGIHAAATGAIWLGVIEGFAGVSVEQGLRIAPRLPQGWRRLRFPLCYQGIRLTLELTPTHLTMTTSAPLTFRLYGQSVSFSGQGSWAYQDFI
ncbi:glycoside hydrolase family 65 protein [Atlantibacter hermannii]|uniref:glycoside hydrolase family 65 protein n=1 Tax=Atlantibacter hermannii TaxID=565 RepID=UPI0022B79050|nr:glycoside hydrolase family 65 protein [Atlantibacter hermannii]MCZ7835152.1 glycoside hydrolase family 65 protein [Atlantibacter hermannii]